MRKQDKPTVITDHNIKGREVTLQVDEDNAIDWAEALAKLTTGGNIEKYLLENNLYTD